MELLNLANAIPINQIPGFFAIVSKDSTYITANQNALNLMGFSSVEELATKHYEDLPCKACESAQVFRQEDLRVIEKRTPIRILSYQCYKDDQWTILLGEKSPILNRKNEVIGISTHFIDITNTDIINLGTYLTSMGRRFNAPYQRKQFSYTITHKNADKNLSVRQAECLFFLIRGYSLSNIAKVLSISLHTVQYHVEELKTKFQAINKTQLIERAINEGLVNLFPESLLKKMLPLAESA